MYDNTSVPKNRGNKPPLKHHDFIKIYNELLNYNELPFFDLTAFVNKHNIP